MSKHVDRILIKKRKNENIEEILWNHFREYQNFTKNIFLDFSFRFFFHEILAKGFLKNAEGGGVVNASYILHFPLNTFSIPPPLIEFKLAGQKVHESSRMWGCRFYP